ncbi:MAG TPA: DMT family transporter [Dehalococcoidia bacterium]|jgi:transporter family-2 protein|nr:DMT family transporter [Dehalococcoidia bacterium]
MTVFAFIIVAMLIGLGSAVQVSMIASLGRVRGAPEAAWINVIAAVLSLALLFAFGALRANPPNLPAPLNNTLMLAAIIVLSGLILAISVRGVSPLLAITGIFGFVYLMGAGYLAPRIGIALFASAVTAGTLIGAVALDHWGAFGADVHRVGFVRLTGVFLLVIGVVFVRYGR